MDWDEQPTVIGTGIASTLTQLRPQKVKKPRQIGFKMADPKSEAKRKGKGKRSR
jgi:hypothetical protein